eukprot:Clim_evm228s157 gene=Clim_evmTU228s157
MAPGKLVESGDYSFEVSPLKDPSPQKDGIPKLNGIISLGMGSGKPSPPLAWASSQIQSARSLKSVDSTASKIYQTFQSTLTGGQIIEYVSSLTSDLVFLFPVVTEGFVGEGLLTFADSNGRFVNDTGKSIGVSRLNTHVGAGKFLLDLTEEGSIATTVIANSQAVRYLMPVIEELAEQQRSVVFHVSCFGINQDLNAFTSLVDGLAPEARPIILTSTSVQEAHDIGIAASLISMVCRTPVIHVFDGLNVANEASTASVLAAHEISALFERKVRNLHVAQIDQTGQFDAVSTVFKHLRSVVRTAYEPFEYHGHPGAEKVVLTNSRHWKILVSEFERMEKFGEKCGVVVVRLGNNRYAAQLAAAIPATATKVAYVADGENAQNPFFSLCTLALAGLKQRVVVKRKVMAGEFFAPSNASALLAGMGIKNKDAVVLGSDRSTKISRVDHDSLLVVSDESFLNDTGYGIMNFVSSVGNENVKLLQRHHQFTPVGGVKSVQIYMSDKKPLSSETVLQNTVVAVTKSSMTKLPGIVESVKNNGALCVVMEDASENLNTVLEETLSEESKISLTTRNISVVAVNLIDIASRLGLKDGDMNQQIYDLCLRVIVLKLWKGANLNVLTAEFDAAIAEELMVDWEPTNALSYSWMVWGSMATLSLPAEWASLKTEQKTSLPFHVTSSMEAVADGFETLGNQKLTRDEASWRLMFPDAYETKKVTRPSVKEETFLVTTTCNKRLTSVNYDRNVFHMEFDIRGTGLKYQIGDALGVYGHNDEEEVHEFLDELGIPAEELIQLEGEQFDHPGYGETRTTLQWFVQVLDLFGKVTKGFYGALSEFAKDPEEAKALMYLASDAGKAEFMKRQEDTYTFADVIREFKSARPEVEDLLSIIPPTKPRHYSIASSMNMHPDSVHLLVVTVEWENSRGQRKGQCTRYLESLKPGTQVTVSIKSSVMRLPDTPSQPIVMSGLGTGMAPFRAFIEERAYQLSQGHEIGPVVLYFGSRHRRDEYLYGEELEAYLMAGVVSRLGLAFSRDQKHKVYIQHKIKEDADMIYSYLQEENGYFYLCGPTWPVPDVKDALVTAFVEHGYTEDSADERIEELKEDGRYILEVY